VLVAPMLYMVKPGVAERLEAWTRAGGMLVLSYFSGVVDENDRVHLGGYPGPLRKLVGVWVEEIDVLPAGESNRVVFSKPFGGVGGSVPCQLLCERIHPEGAEVLATYGEDFYAGEPAITRNRFGDGEAYYVGTALEPAALRALLAAVCETAGVWPVLSELADGVEATVRISPDGAKLLYVLNHNATTVRVRLRGRSRHDLLTGERCDEFVELPPYGVRILVDKEPPP